MARKIQVADGNFTTAATWALCLTATGTEVDSETAQILSTANHDSQTFTPPTDQIDGVALKLAANTQAVGVTMTVHFRNSTTATNDRSVTINAADMPLANTTERQGGWQFFRFGSALTPNGTDVYLIRVTISAGATISLWRDGTVNNFARFIRRTTTGAPAATDRLICCRELTGAGTGTNHTMTMDNTASTVFGTNTGLVTSSFSTGGGVNNAWSIGNGCTVTWGNSASTNYLLRLTGGLVLYSGSTWVRGTSVAPIPISSTAIIEFVLTTSSDSGIGYMTGCTFTEEGEPRTPGNNTVWCLLNTDEAAAQTVLGVDRATGWLAGDSIAIASTTRTQNQGELRTLNTDATATTLEITAGLTNAHGGGVADPHVTAEVVLLTRNVVTRSDNTVRAWKTTIQNITGSMRWVQWSLCGGGGGFSVSTGSFLFEYCSNDRPIGNIFVSSAATTNNFTLRHVVMWSGNSTQEPQITGNTTTDWEISDWVSVLTNGGGMQITTTSAGFGDMFDVRATGPILVSMGGTPTTALPATFRNITVHSAGSGISLSAFAPNGVVEGLVQWRCFTAMQINGQQTLPYSNFTLKDLVSFGNSTSNVIIGSNLAGEIILDNPTIAGDTSFSVATGIDIVNPNTQVTIKVKLLGGTLGGGGGVKTTHTTRDIHWASSAVSVGAIIELRVVNTDLLSTTEVTQGTQLRQPSLYARQSPDGTLANSSMNYVGIGTVAYNTSVVDSPFTVSEHLIPSVTFGATLKSSPVTIKVSSGVAPTVAVRVRYTAAYNGAFLPRLVVKANPAVGVDDDTILDTAPGATADTWVTIGGTLPTPTADGKMLMYVEVDGTTDGAFVSLWSSGSEAVEPGFWLEGLTGGEMDAATGGGGGGAVTRSAVSFG